MDNDDLEKLNITLRKIQNNRKEIYKRKEKFIIKRTQIMFRDILDEYLKMIEDFGKNRYIFKITKRIKIDDINSSNSLMIILNYYIDIDLLKDYCRDLGIIFNIEATDNELYLNFILDKELYENGVYDFNMSSSSNYMDELNLKLKND